MKILLVNPPQTTYAGSHSVMAGLPLGLMYIAAVLDRAGHQVEILDTLVGNFPPRKEGDAIQHGMPWDRIKLEVERRQPRFVGIGNPFTTQVENAIQTARLVKEVNPGAAVIVGGPHVTVRPEEFLEAAPWVDVVVRGEGERTILELLQELGAGRSLDGIAGIAYRKDDEVRISPARELITNLDELPYPAYHLVDMESYFNPGRLSYRSSQFRREVPLITSRGCPYGCVFCSIHLHMGQKWRAHSASYVIDHVEHLTTKYKVEHIHFEDDNLTLNRKRFGELLDGWTARKLRFMWDTPNGVRAEGLTLELLGKMKQTGCVDITVGVESGDQGVLDDIVGKRLRLDEVVLAAQRCRQAGVKLVAFYVIGFPGETKENMQRTIDFALRLKRQYGVNMGLHIATPLPGTRLYEICKSKGYLVHEPTPRALAGATQHHGTGLIRTPEFMPEEVRDMATKAFRRHMRLSLWEFIKDWRVKGRLALHDPRKALRYVRSLVGF